MIGEGRPRGEVECLDPESDIRDGGASAVPALDTSDTAGEGSDGSICLWSEEKCELMVRGW